MIVVKNDLSVQNNQICGSKNEFTATNNDLIVTNNRIHVPQNDAIVPQFNRRQLNNMFRTSHNQYKMSAMCLFESLFLL